MEWKGGGGGGGGGGKEKKKEKSCQSDSIERPNFPRKNNTEIVKRKARTGDQEKQRMLMSTFGTLLRAVFGIISFVLQIIVALLELKRLPAFPGTSAREIKTCRTRRVSQLHSFEEMRSCDTQDVTAP